MIEVHNNFNSCHMKRFLLILIAMLAVLPIVAAEKSYTLTSPDGRVSATVNVGEKLTYSVGFDGKSILAPSQIALHLLDGEVLGEGDRLAQRKTASIDKVVVPQVYFRTQITDRYNELILSFREGYAVEFRAYDEGVVYRFRTARKEDYTVVNEVAEFRFAEPAKAWIAYNNLSAEKKDRYMTSFENTYTRCDLSQVDAKQLAFSPVLVECMGVKVCIAESDVEAYPGMFLCNPDGANALVGHFAPLPRRVVEGGHNKLQGIVRERESYIAKCKGKRTMPWRIILVTDQDRLLAANDMVYRLASPSRVEDPSWIVPGKVAWEWWNYWGVNGVDFVTGVNNPTYKAYIDFASKNKIKYVILDEGWAVKYANDLMQVVPEINLPELVKYAEERGVDLILWAGYNAFNRDIEGICAHYSKMGIKGFKIDFMDRDDAAMVDFHYRVAEAAARHKMLVDFHGTYKPTGLNRTYPNVINFEAVFGLEQVKWGKPSINLVEYDVTMPFIRMLAGPIDYTQGAMRNASKRNYRPVYREPMSQGTRCHQLAEYVVFFSPLSMLCDSPSQYEREPQCLNYISKIPTTWDETVVLDGKVGEYIVTVRRSGNKWYVGALTSWTPREMTVDLTPILGTSGEFKAEVYQDGANAAERASDYRYENISIPADRKLSVKMASGGGYAAIISPR